MNTVRSVMAAAILRHLAGNRCYVLSAGVKAGLGDSFVPEVMDEIGIDVSHHTPQTLRDLHDTSFDLIVTLSPEAHHQALEVTRGTAAEVEYWPVPDPSAVEGSREMRLDAYRRMRDQLLARLKVRFGAPSGPSV